MLSWWFVVGALAVAAPTSSAFAVRQTEIERECVQLMCPETAFENGVKSLVNENSLSTEQCVDCQQCTANGYSVCLGVRPTRASRVDANNPCSCSHSVPTNCHNRLHEKVHPANITMKEYTVCYLSALQAPPRPMAANEKDSVIFTIEAFWLEPYWRQLNLENLTFHYDFAVESPESCEGTVTSSEDGVHLCNNVISLNMTIPGEHDDDKDDEYEHSENYDQYDDDLPEEVEIDKEIFGDAVEVQVYYIVDVNRPRQLQPRDKYGEILRDIKTSVESEILKFDLTAETSSPSVLPTPTETKEEDEDVSTEKGGTDFFEQEKQRENKEEDDDEKDEEADDQDGTEENITESADDEEDGKKEDDKEDADVADKTEDNEKADDGKDEENEEKNEDEETTDDTTVDDEQDGEKDDDERKGQKEPDGDEPPKNENNFERDDKEDESDNNAEDSKDEGTDDGKEDEHEDDGEDQREDKHEEEREDEHLDEQEDEHGTKHEDELENQEKQDKTEGDDKDEDNKDDEQESEDSAHPAEMKHRDDDITDKYDENENEKGDDDGENEEEGSQETDDEDKDEQDEDEKNMTFMQRIMSNKGVLARWVFGVTVLVCLFLVGGVCAYRKRCCCQKEKTSNGNKYSSVTGQQRHLPPEKERLNQ